MTREEAKRILTLYRPWSKDAEDPAFTEALALARSDAELARWFEQHCAAHRAVRGSFRKIAPPAGLKEQIFSEHHARLAESRWRKQALTVAASILVLALVIGGMWLAGKSANDSETSFAAYRNRMVKMAARTYGMDLETNDVSVIRAYLAQHSPYADYQTPRPLASATNTGCGVFTWQGHRVAMVCFHSGEPLPPGAKTDLFLFVMERKAAPDAPKTTSPEFTPVNQLTTASWAQDGLVYLLATPGDEKFLKKFL